MFRAFRVPAAWPKFVVVKKAPVRGLVWKYWLFAPPPAVARMKLVRLKMLNAFASNFTLTLSVTLKVLDRVISAVQYPGPTNVLRPRLPVQPRHGDEIVMAGPVVV